MRGAVAKACSRQPVREKWKEREIRKAMVRNVGVFACLFPGARGSGEVLVGIVKGG